MCGNAPIEEPPKHRALTAAFGVAGALLLVAALAGLLAAVGPRDSVAAVSRSPESAPLLLAQTEPPPGSDLEQEEEDWVEDPSDTLSTPTPAPSPTPTPVPTPAGAVTDSTVRAAGADSTLGAAAGADSTRGVTADSTGRAVMIPTAPAAADTLRPAPGVGIGPTPAGATAPKAASTPPAPVERKGIFGLHPAAIAFGLVLVHYFVVKAATD